MGISKVEILNSKYLNIKNLCNKLILIKYSWLKKNSIKYILYEYNKNKNL